MLENKIEVLEKLILELIEKFQKLEEENSRLRNELLENKKIKEQAIEKIDNIIEKLKKEGLIEKNS